MSGEIERNRRQESEASHRGQVVVLLPALDEEAAVGEVIDRIPRDELCSRGYSVSVWLVDGHSSDATREIAMRKGAAIFVQRGDGKGTGIQQAFEYLSGLQPEAPLGESSGPEYFFMLDSDGTYPPECISTLLRTLEMGYDIVLGSRFRGLVEDGAISGLNRIGNRLLSGLASFLYHVPVSDVCTGMWGFDESLIRRLSLAARGFDLEADLFASACQMKARFAEVPISYRRRIGNPKLVPVRSGLLIAWRLIRRRLTKAGGRIDPSMAPRRDDGGGAE